MTDSLRTANGQAGRGRMKAGKYRRWNTAERRRFDVAPTATDGRRDQQ